MKKSAILIAAAILFGACTQYNLADRFKDAAAGEFGLRIFPVGVPSANFSADIPVISPNCSGDAIDAANCHCTTVAASGITKKGKTFRAWLSTSLVDAVCNVQGLKERGCGVKAFSIAPYRGDAIISCAGSGGDSCYPIVANDLADLVAGKLKTSLIEPPGQSYWTGTGADGTYLGSNADTCTDWTGATTGRAGVSGVTDSAWTSNSTPGCGPSQILCFEQP